MKAQREIEEEKKERRRKKRRKIKTRWKNKNRSE